MNILRCESLMRMAEKEISEMEKRKSVANTGSISASASIANGTSKEKSAGSTRERLTELSKHIAEEARRLALTRGELMKAKGGSVSGIISMDSNSSSKLKTAGKPRPSTDGSKGEVVKTPTHSGRPAVNLSGDDLPLLAK